MVDKNVPIDEAAFVVSVADALERVTASCLPANDKLLINSLLSTITQRRIPYSGDKLKVKPCSQKRKKALVQASQTDTVAPPPQVCDQPEVMEQLPTASVSGPSTANKSAASRVKDRSDVRPYSGRFTSNLLNKRQSKLLGHYPPGPVESLHPSKVRGNTILRSHLHDTISCGFCLYAERYCGYGKYVGASFMRLFWEIHEKYNRKDVQALLLKRESMKKQVDREIADHMSKRDVLLPSGTLVSRFDLTSQEFPSGRRNRSKVTRRPDLRHQEYGRKARKRQRI